MAAEQGEAAAQLALGRIYAENRGVLKDNKRAYMWYNIALNNDHEHEKFSDLIRAIASENIEKIERRMTQADINTAQDMAKRCFVSGYKDC